MKKFYVFFLLHLLYAKNTSTTSDFSKIPSFYDLFKIPSFHDQIKKIPDNNKSSSSLDISNNNLSKNIMLGCALCYTGLTGIMLWKICQLQKEITKIRHSQKKISDHLTSMATSNSSILFQPDRQNQPLSIAVNLHNQSNHPKKNRLQQEYSALNLSTKSPNMTPQEDPLNLSLQSSQTSAYHSTCQKFDNDSD